MRAKRKPVAKMIRVFSVDPADGSCGSGSDVCGVSVEVGVGLA